MLTLITDPFGLICQRRPFLLSLNICSTVVPTPDPISPHQLAQLILTLPRGLGECLFALDPFISPLLNATAPSTVRKAYTMAYLFYHLRKRTKVFLETRKPLTS